MQYQGGKANIARHIAPQIIAAKWATDATTYIEPFMGGAAVFAQVAPYFERAIGSDAHPDIMFMWQAAVTGWKPPAKLTEQEWRELKTAEPSALRGFAGFGCSFGGKWFAGYAKNNQQYDYVNQARRSVVALARRIRGAQLLIGDYTMHTPSVGPHTVIYCDPPYANTTPYQNAGSFDSAQFWSTMAEWVGLGATVLVSEYDAPPKWQSVWSIGKRVTMNKDDNLRRATEHLFMHHTQVPR